MIWDFYYFFELGGDSTKFTQLLSRIWGEGDQRVMMQSLFDKGTVVELARCLTQVVGTKTYFIIWRTVNGTNSYVGHYRR